MQYFPLTTDRFEHQFGIRALGTNESIVQATDDYAAEIKLKRQLLDERPDYYLQSHPDSLPAQREVAALVIDSADFLDVHQNTLLDEQFEIDNEMPLLSITRHVQEDLAIMSGESETGHPLIAGSITFPSGWCIGDKLGKSILAIHETVPEYSTELNPPTERLLDRIKPGRPVWRTNWGIRPSDALDQSPIHADFLTEQRAKVTAANAGHRCYFRVERQTLARLPESNCILFAIHTHQTPLDRLSTDERARLLGVLKTCPQDTLVYKGIFPMLGPLLEHLQSAAV